MERTVLNSYEFYVRFSQSDIQNSVPTGFVFQSAMMVCRIVALHAVRVLRWVRSMPTYSTHQVLSFHRYFEI